MDNNSIMEKEEFNAELKDMVKQRKLKKRIISAAIVIVVVLLAAGIAWGQGRKQGKEKADAEIIQLVDKVKELEDTIQQMIETPIVVTPVAPTIDLDVIDNEIKEIGELATMEYLYTNAARFTDSKQLRDFNIPFTQKSFTLKWDGIIKAGVVVDQITTEVNEETKVLTVHLPQTEILSHQIDNDSVEILDERDGLFNPVRLDDKVKFDVATETEMEERAIENGLLEKAQKNAEDIISKLINANPDIKGNYRIEFKVTAPEAA